MLIDGKTISQQFEKGIWKAYRKDIPLDASDLVIGCNSVDVTLGNRILRPDASLPVNPLADQVHLHWDEWKPTKQNEFYMLPGDFVLGSVQERFDVAEPVDIDFYEQIRCAEHTSMSKGHRIPFYVVPVIDGRSSLARLGLAVHITAGQGDYGFDGQFTLELVNHSKMMIVLTVGMRIAQVSFHTVTPGIVDRRYHGAYDKQHDGPLPPKLGADRF